MAEQMTHRERVRAALESRETDRPPVSVWRHFYRQENSAQGLAEAMLGFQRQFDWDFMKVNPRASYHAEGWGLKLRFSDSDTREPQVADWPVKRPQDWDAVRPLDVNQGVLGEQLEALGLIAKGLNGQVPFLMTVFTPLSIAGRLCESDEAMAGYMKDHPARVHEALETITDTFVRFSRECLSMGASGLFFATTSWGTYDRLTDEQYAEFGRPYDLRVLEAVSGAEFNLLHVCRSHNMLAALADYPVAAFNWDARDETNLPLKKGEEVTGKAVIGGVSHRDWLRHASPEQVASDVRRTLEAMKGSRWMLGPGCTIPASTPEANVRAIRDALA